MATIRYQPPRRGPAAARPVRTAKPVSKAPPPPNRAKPPKSAGPAPEPAQVQNAARRRRRTRQAQSAGLFGVLIIGLFLLAAIVALPTVPIVVIGMAPTAVAFFIDRSQHKTAAICVAGLNFAGVAPFVSMLWKGPNTLYHSMAIMTDVYSWLAMYGAAALGWLLYLGLPPVAKSLLRIRSQQQVASLRSQQAKLLEEWGVGPTAKKP